MLYPASAAVVPYVTETWSAAGLAGWTAAIGNATVNNPGGYLQVSFPTLGSPPDPSEDAEIVNTTGSPATSQFVGNYSGIAGVTFDFLAENVEPGFVQLRWNSANNDHTWRYTFAVTDVGSWNSYNIVFQYATGWTGDAGWNNEDQFVADLCAMNWIGFYISRGSPSTSEQTYGFDNFELYVPEPDQIGMLCAAGIALVLFARRRAGKPDVHG